MALYEIGEDVFEFPDDATEEQILAYADNLLPKQEASYGAIAKTAAKSAPYHMFAGITGTMKAGLAGLDPEFEWKRLDRASKNWTRKLHEEMSKVQTEEGSFKDYVNQAEQSISATAPGIGLAFINPWAGAGYFGVQTTGETFLQYDQDTKDRRFAAYRAAVGGVTEAGLSFLPLKTLVGGPTKGKFLGWIMKLAGLEVGTEIATETIQSAIDKAEENPEMEWGEFAQTLPKLGVDTAIVSVLQSMMLAPLGLAKVSMRKMRLANRGDKDAQKEVAEELEKDIQARGLSTPVEKVKKKLQEGKLSETSRKVMETALGVEHGKLSEDELKQRLESMLAQADKKKGGKKKGAKQAIANYWKAGEFKPKVKKARMVSGASWAKGIEGLAQAHEQLQKQSYDGNSIKATMEEVKPKAEEATVVRRTKQRTEDKITKNISQPQEAKNLKVELEQHLEDPDTTAAKVDSGREPQMSKVDQVEMHSSEYFEDSEMTAQKVPNLRPTFEHTLRGGDPWLAANWLTTHINNYYHTGTGDIEGVGTQLAKLIEEGQENGWPKDYQNHLEGMAKYLTDVVLARSEIREVSGTDASAVTASSTAVEVRELTKLIDGLQTELVELDTQLSIESTKAEEERDEALIDVLTYDREELLDQITRLEMEVDDVRLDQAITLDFFGSQTAFNFIKATVKSLKKKMSKHRVTVAEIERGRLHDVGEREDISPWAEWFRPTERALENFPEAQRLAVDIRGANAYGNELLRDWLESSNESKSQLSVDEQKEVTKVLRGGMTNNSKSLLHARRLQDIFGGVREHVKDYYRGMFKDSLAKTEYSALREVLVGENPLAMALKYNVDYKTLTDAQEKMQEIDNWGIDDFITNFERGSLRIVEEHEKTLKNGKVKKTHKTVAFAPTRRIAYEKAMKRILEAKEAGEAIPNLMLDSSPQFDDDSLVEVGKKQYGVMIGKVNKAIKEEADYLNKELRNASARRILGKVVTVKPRFVASKVLKKRRDVLEGEENVFDALPGYFRAIAKKTSLDPVIHNARKYIADGSNPKNVRSAIENIIKSAKGVYSPEDHWADSFLALLDKKFSKYTDVFDKDPMQYTRAVATARKVEANIKLGYRPTAAAINYMSGQGHSWVAVGRKIFAEAKKFKNSERGKKFLHEEKDYLGANLVEESTGVIRTQAKVWHALGLFQYPEPNNRETAMCAYYLYGKADGMSEEAARYFARTGVGFTQAFYDITALPRILRGPTGKLIGQFKPYLINELEFISHLRGPQIYRYLGMQMFLGGFRGMMLTIKSIPILGALGYMVWDDIEEWMNKFAPRFYRGAPGFVPGVDISAAAAVQLGTRIEDWAGPFLADIYRLHKNVFLPMMEGKQPMPIGEFGTAAAAIVEGDKQKLDLAHQTARHKPMYQWMRDATPALYWWDQALSLVLDDEGWVRDDKGRRVYKPENEWADLMKFASGTRSVEMSQQQTAERLWEKDEKKRARDKSEITDRILDVIESNGSLAEGVIEEASELGVTNNSLQRAAVKRRLTPRQRKFLATQVRFRAEAAQRLGLLPQE